MKTIDLTPTWRGLMPYLIELLRSGTPEGRKAATDELMRLADYADSVNRHEHPHRQGPAALTYMDALDAKKGASK